MGQLPQEWGGGEDVCRKQSFKAILAYAIDLAREVPLYVTSGYWIGVPKM